MFTLLIIVVVAHLFLSTHKIITNKIKSISNDLLRLVVVVPVYSMWIISILVVSTTKLLVTALYYVIVKPQIIKVSITGWITKVIEWFKNVKKTLEVMVISSKVNFINMTHSFYA